MVITQWATPDIDRNIMFMARVSNPKNQRSEQIKLLYYCADNGHVSPFDMANICFEIHTTRDIARQMIRHSSIKVQEFSQRYQTVDQLGHMLPREFRLQHPTNRQLSIEVDADDPRHQIWSDLQGKVIRAANHAYNWCIRNGGAKEVARVVLPEGLAPSLTYFNGTVRSWIHYLQSRLDESTQKEHRLIAQQILVRMRQLAPITTEAFFGEEK